MTGPSKFKRILAWSNISIWYCLPLIMTRWEDTDKTPWIQLKCVHRWWCQWVSNGNRFFQFEFFQTVSTGSTHFQTAWTKDFEMKTWISLRGSCSDIKYSDNGDATFSGSLAGSWWKTRLSKIVHVFFRHVKNDASILDEVIKWHFKVKTN